MKEILLKEWRANEARVLGVSEQVVNKRMYRFGRYSWLKKRYLSKRTVLVPAIYSTESERPRPGEVHLKTWVVNEAARLGLKHTAVYMRIKRGKYPNLILRYINKRVVFVRVAT